MVAPPALALVIAAALVATLIATYVPVQHLAAVVVAASFAPRFTLSLGSFDVRPEHAAVAVLCLSVVVQGRLGNAVRAAVRPPALWLLALVVAGGFLSALVSPSLGTSVSIVGWLGISWCGMVALMASAPSAGWLLRVGVAFAGVTGVISLVLFLLDVAAISDFGVAAETLTAANALRGLSPEQNLLGGMMALWCFVALTQPGASRPRYYLPVAAVCAVALFLTLTRAAAIGLVLGLLVWVMLSGDGRTRLRVLGAVACIGVAIAAAAVAFPEVSGPALTKYSPSEIVNVQSGTGDFRSNRIKQAMDDLDDNAAWVTGLGVNTFGLRHTSPYSTGRTAYLPALPLQVLYDTGIIGVVLMLGALGALIPRSGAMRARVFGAVTVFALVSSSTSSFWFVNTWILLAAATMRLTEVASARAARRTQQSRTGRVASRPSPNLA